MDIASDSVVPFELGRELFAAAREPKTFYAIPEADHNDTREVGGSEYLTTLADFLAEDGRDATPQSP